MGLHVKAIVYDRCSTNSKILGDKFDSGVHSRKRADGSTHLMPLLYDYPHLEEAQLAKCKKEKGSSYNVNLINELAKMKEPCSPFWAYNGSMPSYSSPRGTRCVILQSLNNIQVSTFKAAIKNKKTTPTARRKERAI